MLAAVRQRTDISPQDLTAIEENAEIRASVDRSELASKNGNVKITSPVQQPVKLTKAQVVERYQTADVLKSRSTGTLASVQASLKPTIVETHNANLGNAATISKDDLAGMIRDISSQIKSGVFKGMNVQAANGNETTNSADVFLGWLKAAAAGGSAEPGIIVSKPA